MRRDYDASSSLPDEEVNLTPLIDVVFILLITFILVAPLFEIDKIELAQGSAKVQREAAKESRSLMIEVKSDDTVLFNKKPVSIETLSMRLIEEKKRTPGAIPQLFQDKKAHFGTYQQVKNAVEGAGFTELDVLLQPGEK